MLFTIKNKDKEPRQFIDKHLGKAIILQPGEKVSVEKLPPQSEFFEIKATEEKEEKKPKKKITKLEVD